MDKINVNAIDASMATEGATDFLLGVDASGEVKKTNIAALDTYSRAEIDAKNAEDKQYADLQVSALIGGATPENLNTLSELATALEKEGDAIVAINSELGTKYSPSNKPTPADIGALPVGHVPLYVGAADKRQVIPSQVGGNRIEPLFVSNLTLGIGNPSGYSDLVVLNTYTDPTGGFMNALAFDKTSKSIYHFQSDMKGTEWGLASVVYTSANPPTLSGMKALGYGNWATDADILSNGSGFTYGVNAPHAGPILDVGPDNTGGSYHLQLNALYGNGRNLAFRVNNGDTAQWNPWFELYHTGNKPTPAELGALPVNEPVATGRMGADSYRVGGGGVLYSSAGGRIWITNKALEGTHKGIGIDDSTGALYWDGAVERPIWHNGNVPETATRWPSAAEVGALPLSGGNINGPLATTGVIRSDAQVRGFGTGNTFGSAGLETGATTADPSISFHKEGLYACTLRLTGNAQFGLFNQNNGHANLNLHHLYAASISCNGDGFSGNGSGLTDVPFGQVKATEHLLFNDPAGLNGGNFVLSQPFYHYKALVFYTSDDSSRYMYSMTKTVEEINRLQSFGKPYGIMADSSYFWNGSFAADGRTFVTAAESGRVWQVIGLT